MHSVTEIASVVCTVTHVLELTNGLMLCDVGINHRKCHCVINVLQLLKGGLLLLFCWCCQSLPQDLGSTEEACICYIGRAYVIWG